MAISVFDADADARCMHDFKPVDHRDLAARKIGLNGQVGHDHQGHGAMFGGVVAGIVLDDAGDADALFTQNLGESREDAGPVGDGEVEVVTAVDLAGRREDDGRG